MTICLGDSSLSSDEELDKRLSEDCFLAAEHSPINSSTPQVTARICTKKTQFFRKNILSGIFLSVAIKIVLLELLFCAI